MLAAELRASVENGAKHFDGHGRLLATADEIIKAMMRGEEISVDESEMEIRITTKQMLRKMQQQVTGVEMVEPRKYVPTKDRDKCRAIAEHPDEPVRDVLVNYCDISERSVTKSIDALKAHGLLTKKDEKLTPLGISEAAKTPHLRRKEGRGTGKKKKRTISTPQAAAVPALLEARYRVPAPSRPVVNGDGELMELVNIQSTVQTLEAEMLRIQQQVDFWQVRAAQIRARLGRH